MATELIDQIKEEAAIAKVSVESVSLYDKVMALVVRDQASYDFATECYKMALAVEKAAHAAHDPVCNHWDKLHDKACEERKKDLDKVLAAKKLSKSKADTWALAQENIRLEKERKDQEEARRKHQEEERKARAEAERIRAESARIEEEARLALAAEAEQSGATAAQVNEILDTPVYVAPEPAPYVPPAYVPPTVAPTFQKAAGISSRTIYKGKVVNFHTLFVAAQSNPYLETYLQANEAEINALAGRTKEAFQLPGCILDKKRV